MGDDLGGIRRGVGVGWRNSVSLRAIPLTDTPLGPFAAFLKVHTPPYLAGCAVDLGMGHPSDLILLARNSHLE